MRIINSAVGVGLVFGLVALSACGSSGSESVDEVTDTVDQALADADSRADEFAEVLREQGLTSLATAFENVEFSQLTDSEEFTFFAPNDEAFVSLSSDEIADLLSDSDRIAAVLQNHTVEQRLTAAEIADSGSVNSASGTELQVVASGDTVTVGDATVITSDVEVGDGGIVHVVDRLLLP